jgi:hypothetical protein
MSIDHAIASAPYIPCDRAEERLSQLRRERSELSALKRDAAAQFTGAPSILKHHGDAFGSVVEGLYHLDNRLNHGRVDYLSRAYALLVDTVLRGHFGDAAALGLEMDEYACRNNEDREVIRALSNIRGSLRGLRYDMKYGDKKSNRPNGCC